MESRGFEIKNEGVEADDTAFVPCVKFFEKIVKDPLSNLADNVIISLLVHLYRFSDVLQRRGGRPV